MSTILPNKIYVIDCYKWKWEKVTFINQAGWMAPSAVCTDLTQMILVPFVNSEGEEKKMVSHNNHLCGILIPVSLRCTIRRRRGWCTISRRQGLESIRYVWICVRISEKCISTTATRGERRQGRQGWCTISRRQGRWEGDGEGGGDAQLVEGKGSALKLHPLTSVVAWAAFDFECHQMLWFQLLLHIKHLNVHQTTKDMSKAPPLIILWIISPLRSCIVYKSPKYCKSNLYFQL